MNWKITLFSLITFIAVSCAQDKNFDEMVKGYYENTVPLIKSNELKIIPSDSVVILDSREMKEYKISHLKEARYAGYDNFEASCLEGVSKGQKIVVYCSIGYRSERIGEQLKAKGYTNVYNLYGGIFDWVNQGNEVVDGKGKKTEKVHTYNKKWSKWLQKGEKVY